MAEIMVVFDFDDTIIGCDSDKWVADEMGTTEILNELLPTLPWNSAMDRVMKEIHSLGKTIKQIADCLKMVPLHPRIISGIKSAHALGCDLRIISDANIFFIETILKHYGIFDCFSKIYSNPSCINEDGRLRIFPYSDPRSPHGCCLCPRNMCKGLIIEKIQASISSEATQRLIYVGDGKGDFCPSTKLKEGDHVMPRKNFPLWAIISSNPSTVKTKVHAWDNAGELERLLIRLVTKICSEESSCVQFASAPDCKPASLTISAQEAFLQSLSIPH